MQPQLTVMLSTRNRSEGLRLTLQHMARVRRPSGWSTEFVIVDNGSTDATAGVLREAEGWLPLKRLSCSLPGKSNALNVGLEQARLGSLVVFTDDDVTPDEDWFDAIVAACQRWPDHSVFGGRIDPTWPDGEQLPSWARAEFIQSFAFTRHVIDSVEREYPSHIKPFGPNYWVRRDAIRGMRFSGALGPRPKHRKLGQETEFLFRLCAKGHVPVYAPSARVEHRIESARLSKLAVYMRAFQLGRGMIYTRGLPDAHGFERSRLLWRLERAHRLAKRIAELPLAVRCKHEDERVLSIVHSLMWAGVEAEAMRVRAAATALGVPS